MTHVSGQEFCVMPRCHATPDPRLAAPLCAKHAIDIHLEVANFAAPRRIKHAPSRPTRNTLDEAGEVYVMEVDGRAKIGFSTDVPQRAKRLGGKVLATIPGTRRDERRLHAKYGHPLDRRRVLPARAGYRRSRGIDARVLLT